MNLYFGLNNTVADLLGTAVARIQPLEAEPSNAAPDSKARSRPLRVESAGVHATKRNSAQGRHSRSVSGFSAREAYIYLAPAYQTAPRPSLPVLVLFSGQPGGPADWLTGGQLRSQLDRFAEAHHGVAPVTVVVDPNGSANANTMCMDSHIAPADTYLSKDVPAWITSTLDVSD